MKQIFFLFLLVSLISSSFAEGDVLVGEWKVNDKNKYMSLTIKDVNESGLELFYDEGIGINGIRANGIIQHPKNNIRFVDVSIRGSQCRLKLKLKLVKNKKLSVSGCELESYLESSAERMFVPKSQKLYYKASFNCAKAETNIELAICNSKIISAADRKLGSIYKKLRKTLTKKNKKRLRKEQIRWIKNRNWKCKREAGETLNYCLRKYYGQRLLALNVLNQYKIWHKGSLDYSLFRTLNKKKASSSYNVMDNGLGLWLSGKIKRPLIDTGYYETQVKFSNDSYILSGPYSSDPSAGHDPRAFSNKIFIEFSSSKDMWIALVDSGRNLIYLPKNKNISNASEKFKSWVTELKEPEIINIF